MTSCHIAACHASPYTGQMQRVAKQSAQGFWHTVSKQMAAGRCVRILRPTYSTAHGMDIAAVQLWDFTGAQLAGD